jgi:hypothetical protein
MMGAYERIAQRLLIGQPKPARFGMLVGHHFWTGYKSLHRTRQSRKWRLFWKIKSVRQKP